MQLDLQESCSCFFVSGDVVGGDWKLRPEVIEPLVKAVMFAGKQTKKFRFSATWHGDPAPHVEDLGLEEFVAMVSNASISGRYLYVVEAA